VEGRNFQNFCRSEIDIFDFEHLLPIFACQTMLYFSELGGKSLDLFLVRRLRLLQLTEGIDSAHG
jgi:hypothetical protein